MALHRLFCLLILISNSFSGICQFDLKQGKNKYASQKELLYPRTKLVGVSNKDYSSLFNKAIYYLLKEIDNKDYYNRLVDKRILQRRGLSDYDILKFIKLNLEQEKVDVIIYYRRMNANGKAKKNNKRMLVKESVFQSKNHKKLAGVILHEYAHILGFKHFPLVIKKLSVPYTLERQLR